VRRPGEPAAIEATTVNVSCSGVYFLCGERFLPGEVVDFELRFPEDLDPGGRLLSLQCRVSILREEPAGASSGYGIAGHIDDYTVAVGPYRVGSHQRHAGPADAAVPRPPEPA
jgi:hypothetical protein